MELIVVANQSSVKVFSYKKEKGLKIRKQFVNSSGRMKNIELEEDKPGTSHARYNASAPHSLGTEKSAVDEKTLKFIRTVSRSLTESLH